MSLSDLLASGRPAGARVDKVLLTYELMNGSDREAFRALIANDLWSSTQIAKALRAMGHTITDSQIRHFRNKIKDGTVTLVAD